MRILIILLLSVNLLFQGCNANKNRIDLSGLYSPAEGNRYAQLFSISDSGDYYYLEIRNPWQGANEVTYTYYLTRSDTIPANIVEGARVIKIPVKEVVCMSTTHIAMIENLGEAKGIVGVSGVDWVTSKVVNQSISNNSVKEIGYDSNLNNEIIASLNPDLVFVFGIGSEARNYLAKLQEVNIPVMFIGDYLEVHPLARAEWIRVFGALYNKLTAADEYFRSISDSYISLQATIDSLDLVKPEVMLGLPFKDTWFISPANSYISKLIEDAGGNYIWHDNISDVSIPMGLESVFLKCMESDIWINPGSATSLQEILSVDSRFEVLPPILNRNVYNNIKRLNAKGGNDYWESGILTPHIILKDMVSIFHPDMFHDYDTYYYLKIN